MTTGNKMRLIAALLVMLIPAGYLSFMVYADVTDKPYAESLVYLPLAVVMAPVDFATRKISDIKYRSSESIDMRNQERVVALEGCRKTIEAYEDQYGTYPYAPDSIVLGEQGACIVEKEPFLTKQACQTVGGGVIFFWNFSHCSYRNDRERKNEPVLYQSRDGDKNYQLSIELEEGGRKTESGSFILTSENTYR